MFINSQREEATYLLFSVALQAVLGSIPGHLNIHIQPVPSFPEGGKKTFEWNALPKALMCVFLRVLFAITSGRE